MHLGDSSIGLSVKDIAASRAFYEALGFNIFMGDAAQGWLILKNGDHLIGLFQGMFERNMLTFNPGWDSNANTLAEFTDVRELQRQLKARGIALATEADETTTGPASFMVIDPEGIRSWSTSTSDVVPLPGSSARPLRETAFDSDPVEHCHDDRTRPPAGAIA